MSTRGQFLVAAASSLASVAIVRYPGEAAEFSFKYGHPAPATHPLHLRASEMWAAIKRETNGRVNATVFPNSVLGGDTALLSQLRSGAIEFLSFTGGTLGSVVPEASMDAIGYAYKTRTEVLTTLDGPLGAHICARMEARGIHGFRQIWENGYREITSSTHPIHTAADLAGFKIRTPAAPLWVDLFTTLGAAPTPMNFSEVYTALQTHVIDGQENPLALIETSRVYEVQKYLSRTNHMWSGYWFVANGEAWSKLPKDVQGVIERNAEKYALLERSDVAALNDSLAAKLRTQGLTVNEVDQTTFRAKLAPYYAKQRSIYGETAWGLLEKNVGKLG